VGLTGSPPALAETRWVFGICPDPDTISGQSQANAREISQVLARNTSNSSGHQRTSTET
jgi:hypothetical protein